MSFKIHKMRHIWTIKTSVVPPCTIGIFIYCVIVGSKGATSHASTPEELHGSLLVWAFVFAAQIHHRLIFTYNRFESGHCSICQISTERWMVAAPHYRLLKTAICMLGIFGTNALAYKYGETYWNLWDMCYAILTHNWSGCVRFALFLFAVVMAVSEQVKNLSANLISFGAESTCLVLKYLNINRAMIFGLTVGFIIQPWHILATAKSYLNFIIG